VRAKSLIHLGDRNQIKGKCHHSEDWRNESTRECARLPHNEKHSTRPMPGTVPNPMINGSTNRYIEIYYGRGDPGFLSHPAFTFVLTFMIILLV
jgi:hypothetical protein